MKKILVLHGPNLDTLGKREPAVYGTTSLEALNDMLIEKADRAGLQLIPFQSNSEAELINAIHEAAENQINYLIVNAAAFSHTSIALRDALSAASIPFIEVHISNIFSREPFRHHSWLSDIAIGVICGFGIESYSLALQAIVNQFTINH